MAITFRSCLDWLSNIIGDYFASTTTADGNLAKTTFIDTSLARFPDDWLKQWWLILGDKKGFISPTSHNDPENVWDSEPWAYDGDTDTSAGTRIDYEGVSFPLQLLFKYPFKCFKVRVTPHASENIITMYVNGYLGNSLIFSHIIDREQWNIDIPVTPPKTIDRIDIIFYCTGVGTGLAYIKEIDAEAVIGLELRQIKAWHQADCVGEVYAPAPERILSAFTYSLHRFSPDDKQRCINEALYDVYPSLYLRVQEEITGLGSSYNEYDVPAAFAESYPRQAYIKKTVNNIVSYERLFDISYRMVNGVAKLYATIETDETLVLIGGKPLIPFTSLDSSLDISDKCARVICLKAAVNLYRMQTSLVNAGDAGRFEALATRWEAQYNELIKEAAMSPLLDRVRADWSWLG